MRNDFGLIIGIEEVMNNFWRGIPNFLSYFTITPQEQSLGVLLIIPKKHPRIKKGKGT
jgi:hypothetical protein